MATTLKAAGYNFPANTTTTKETNTMRVPLIILVAVIAAMLFVPSTASAALYPVIGKAKISNTKALRSAMKDRPEIAAKLVAQTGGGKVKRSEWTQCGTVTPSQRADLARKGYKNTALDANGNEQTVGSLKDEKLVWACRADPKQVEDDLRKKMGAGKKAKCVTKTYKSGTLTVRCSQREEGIVVQEPVRVKRVPIGWECFNRQHNGKKTSSETIMSGVYTALKYIEVKKGETIVCPGGASATAVGKAKAKGFGWGRTRAEAVKMAKANAYASVQVWGSCPKFTPPEGCEVTKTCPPPPPPGKKPDCEIVNNGVNNGIISCGGGNVQICSANVVYNGNEALCNLYMKCVAIQGNTWNSTQHVCVTPPPPPPPETCETKPSLCPPPPPPGAPELVAVTVINDVYVGMTSPNFCATVSLPGTNTGTLIMSPKYGSFKDPSSGGTVAGGTVRFTVRGSDRVCATYVAPGEAVPGGYETVKVTLRDNVTGLSAAADTQSFPIKVMPPNPE